MYQHIRPKILKILRDTIGRLCCEAVWDVAANPVQGHTVFLILWLGSRWLYLVQMAWFQNGWLVGSPPGLRGMMNKTMEESQPFYKKTLCRRRLGRRFRQDLR